MNEPPGNLARSVKQRLVNRSRERGEVFNHLLIRFAAERFLFRLTQSPHASRFVLKGAMLFAIWADKPYRPTLDVDLLGTGDPDPEDLRRVFADVCTAKVDSDGLRFDKDSITADPIREEQVYAGVRVKLNAYLGKARIAVQVDVGFGDAITPAPSKLVFGPLLDFPAPKVLTYPRESVIAEKFETMVVLGMANSRMKDFCDLWMLSHIMQFDGQILVETLRATFMRRGTQIPTDLPLALQAEFAGDDSKAAQWRGFVARSGVNTDLPALPEVIRHLALFLAPLLGPASTKAPFSLRWNPPGPWKRGPR